MSQQLSHRSFVQQDTSREEWLEKNGSRKQDIYPAWLDVRGAVPAMTLKVHM
jgi:hypothetical protein